jgi:hypothetical protein
MFNAHFAAQLAEEFIENNQALVAASGLRVKEVQDVLVKNLDKKWTAYRQGCNQIMEPVGDNDGFAESAVGRLQSRVMEWLRGVPAETLGEKS